MKAPSIYDAIHQPVLCEEVLRLLDPTHCKTYVDCTLGLAGHTIAMLEKNPNLAITAFDQDQNAREKALARLKEKNFDINVKVIPHNFEVFSQYINTPVDAILFDIGVSSLQLDTPERGFSYIQNGPLDMRMNPTENTLTAAIILNTWTEEDICQIFWKYGEIPYGQKLAHAVITKRNEKIFQTTIDFSSFLEEFQKTYKIFTKKNICLLPFQALRIAVNRELEVLENTIHQALDQLTPGGRIGIISFHSLEDKIVKNIFKSREKKEKLQKYPQTKTDESICSNDNKDVRILTKKPIKPSKMEVSANPRSRSACLRVAEKIAL